MNFRLNGNERTTRTNFRADLSMATEHHNQTKSMMAMETDWQQRTQGNKAPAHTPREPLLHSECFVFFCSTSRELN